MRRPGEPRGEPTHLRVALAVVEAHAGPGRRYVHLPGVREGNPVHGGTLRALERRGLVTIEERRGRWLITLTHRDP